MKGQSSVEWPTTEFWETGSDVAFNTFPGSLGSFPKGQSHEDQNHKWPLSDNTVSAYSLHVNAMKKAVLKVIWLGQFSWTDSWGSQII